MSCTFWIRRKKAAAMKAQAVSETKTGEEKQETPKTPPKKKSKEGKQ